MIMQSQGRPSAKIFRKKRGDISLWQGLVQWWLWPPMTVESVAANHLQTLSGIGGTLPRFVNYRNATLDTGINALHPYVTPSGWASNDDASAGYVSFAAASAQFAEFPDSSGNRSFGPASVTFAVWVYPISDANNKVVFAKSDATQINYELFYSNTAGSFVFRFFDLQRGRLHTVTLPNFIFGNAWYLVIVAFDYGNARVSIRLNAGADTYGSSIATSLNPAADFRIGARAGSAPQYFNGRIKHLLRWNRLLTNEEKSALWNATNLPAALGATLTHDPNTTGLLFPANSGPLGYTLPLVNHAPPEGTPADGAAPSAAPSALALTVNDPPSVTLRWILNATNAHATEVWRSTDGGTYALAFTTQFFADTVTLADDPAAAAHSYKVRAVNEYGPSAYTAVVATPAPDAPSGTAWRADTGELWIDWADNSINETGFEVQAALDGGSFGTIAISAANEETYHTPYSDAPDFQRAARVRAINASGNSAWSATAYTAPVPAGISDLENLSGDYIQISYDHPIVGGTAWVDSIEIQFSLDESTWSPAVLITSGFTGSVTHQTGQASMTTIYYRIRANKAGLSSAWVQAADPIEQD